jgi:hypothetical protein
MVPGFGQQPRFIVTIQPAGTLFSPPAAISIPNSDGLKAREVTEMYSFDHDLGTFVSVGTATVSDDATLIRSDPGVGVLKAGWYCGGPPTPAGSVGVCGECKKCNGTACVADALQDNNACKDSASGFKGACSGGTCNTCPTSLSLGTAIQMSLTNLFAAGYRSLGGIITPLKLAPNTVNFDGNANIVETVSTDAANSTCPANFGNFCAGSSTFTIGTGGTAFDGTPVQGQHNIFFDQHYATNTLSLLDAGGIDSCKVICLQTYSCNSKSVGNFTITRVLTKGTIQGQKVTLITTTKQ